MWLGCRSSERKYSLHPMLQQQLQRAVLTGCASLASHQGNVPCRVQQQRLLWLCGHSLPHCHARTPDAAQLSLMRQLQGHVEHWTLLRSRATVILISPDLCNCAPVNCIGNAACCNSAIWAWSANETHACRGADLVHAVPAGVFEHLPDAAELERWAQTRWEVHHLAGWLA